MTFFEGVIISPFSLQWRAAAPEHPGGSDTNTRIPGKSGKNMMASYILLGVIIAASILLFRHIEKISRFNSK